jgi:hypothetical protein
MKVESMVTITGAEYESLRAEVERGCGRRWLRSSKTASAFTPFKWPEPSDE